jgi:hypothetical protein
MTHLRGIFILHETTHEFHADKMTLRRHVIKQGRTSCNKVFALKDSHTSGVNVLRILYMGGSVGIMVNEDIGHYF